MTAADVHLARWRQNHELFRELYAAFEREIARSPRPVEPEPMHIPVSSDEE